MKYSKKILLVLLIIFFLLSICMGRYPLSLTKIMKCMMHPVQNQMEASVLFQIRLPRVVLTMLCGAALSLAGYVYQSIFHNPLVSGDVLGVTQGCSVGAIASIILGGGAIFTQSLSFIFGVVTVFLCIRMASLLKGDRTLHLILVGIVVGALANALIMMLKMSADPYRDLPGIEFWLMGSFSTANWKDVLLCSVVIGSATLLIYRLRYSIYVLSHGEEEAMSLGLEVKRVRIYAIMAATFLISSVISVAGIVSWVGLIAPHLIRLFTQKPFYQNVGNSMLMGALLLLCADTLSRTLWSFEMPISILTSVMGALFLWYLLVKKGVRL